MQPRNLKVKEVQAYAASLTSESSSWPSTVGHSNLPLPELPASVNSGAKRIFDVLGAIILGLLFSPLILLIIAWIRFSGSPVIYAHRRVGRLGKPFYCLKFRTM